MYLFYVSSTETRIHLKYRTFAKNDKYGTGTGTYRHLQKTVPGTVPVRNTVLYVHVRYGRWTLTEPRKYRTRGKKQEYIYLLEC